MSPFRRVNKHAVIASFVGGSAIITLAIAWPVCKPSLFSRRGAYFGYSKVDGYCTFVLASPEVDVVHGAINALLVGIPAVLTTASFVLSTVSLNLQHQQVGISRARNLHRASVTLLLFTATFLLCNLPTFTNISLYTYSGLGAKYPGEVYSSNFMYFYSWVLSAVLAPGLNSTLNPVLYFYRMPGYRAWLCNRFLQ